MSKICHCIEACCRRFKQHPYLNALYIVLCILSLASFVLLIRSLIVNPDKDTNCVWQDWEFWSVSLYGCLTLWVISYNLMKFIDVEAIKALSDLRYKLHDDDNRIIHKLLMSGGNKNDDIVERLRQKSIRSTNTKSTSSASGSQEPSEKNSGQALRSEVDDMDLFNYLGTIEQGSIMLQRGIISFDEFFNQFGYRVQNIANCKDVMNHVRSEGEIDYYDNLLYVIDEFHRRKMTR